MRNLDRDILHYLIADSLTYQNWISFFPVYQMPADTDMKNFVKEQPGKYQINDSLIVFTPDTPFKKHQRFFARFYSNGLVNNRQQVALSKGNLNQSKYREFVFNF